jgi:hypothetical protein
MNSDSPAWAACGRLSVPKKREGREDACRLCIVAWAIVRAQHRGRRWSEDEGCGAVSTSFSDEHSDAFACKVAAVLANVDGEILAARLRGAAGDVG